MGTDLLEQIQAELARRRPQWQQISDEADVSYSIVYKLALRSYKSSPTYSTLTALNNWLREHPRPKRKTN